MGEVIIAVLPRCARFSLRAGPEAAARIGAAFGVAPDDAPCRAAVAADRAALWLGPDEWLLVAPDGMAPPRVTVPASIVDVSHSMIGITIAGPRAAEVLNAFCALDLDAAFPTGACTRTLFGKVEIILWRCGPWMFRIEVARSFASYVQTCLAEAAREFLP
jgi:heterotetrameric sarcosine oxidase gamma subunit